MKIEPVASPTQSQTAQAAQNSAQDARARAIAKLSTGGPQTHPVSNPSQVAPEEMTALAPKGQTNTSETSESAPQEAKPASEAPKTDVEPLSKQYAVLARKERALRAQVQGLQAREDALRAREAALSAKDVEYQSQYVQKDKLVQDPLSMLSELGISYDQLTEKALQAQQGQDPVARYTISKLEAEIKALRTAQEQGQKSAEEQQTQQYKQAVQQLTRDTQQLVSTDPNFEMIKATKSTKDVVQLIERTFKEDGYLMSVEEAAQAVEDYLLEESENLLKINKIKQRLATASTPAQAKSQPQQQTQQPQNNLKTLTNNIGSTRQLSAKERAILAFKGELKK